MLKHFKSNVYIQSKSNTCTTEHHFLTGTHGSTTEMAKHSCRCPENLRGSPSKVVGCDWRKIQWKTATLPHPATSGGNVPTLWQIFQETEPTGTGSPSNIFSWVSTE